MDPVTLIAAALAAGAGAGITKTASSAVTDTYAALKALVLRKVRNVPGGAVAVEQHESDPDTWGAPVAKALRESGAADDGELVSLARQLLVLVHGDTTTTTTTITASGKRSVAANTIIGNVQTGDGPSAPEP
jgi:hypothetical protein